MHPSPSDTGAAAPIGPVRALLYTANSANPGFCTPTLEEASATISTAVGPSGPNRDYLLNLAAWLQVVDEPDEHVAGLVRLLAPEAGAGPFG